MKRAAVTSGRIAPEDRSVVSSLRGIPGWAAVLLLVVFVAIAWAVEWGQEILGRPFTVLFFLGAVLAVLIVRRRALFTAAVQPPLVAVVSVLLFQFFTAGGFGSPMDRTEILTILVPLAKRFPLIIVTTIVVVAIALVRAYVLEPRKNRAPRAAASAPSARAKSGSHAAPSRRDARRAAPRTVSPASEGAPARRAAGDRATAAPGFGTGAQSGAQTGAEASASGESAGESPSSDASRAPSAGGGLSAAEAARRGRRRADGSGSSGGSGGSRRARGRFGGSPRRESTD